MVETLGSIYESTAAVPVSSIFSFLISNKLFLKKFGLKVQQRRKELGISQEELAYRAGVHRTYIGMIERAERNITLSNIKRLADALGVEVKELFD